MEYENKREWTNRLKNLIRNNKFLSITILSFIICSVTYVIMVLNFLKILQNI